MRNIEGQRFGKLVAIRPTDKRSRKHVVWECLCDCGNITFVAADCLKHSMTKSCGCSRQFIHDLANQRFGKLLAVRPTEKRSGSRVVWQCQCDCGNTTFVSAQSLKTGDTRSCGCVRTEINTIAGQRFGKLVAVCATEKRSGNSIVWKCRCDCGNTAFVARNSLKSGNTKSCGCLRRKASVPKI